MQRLFFIQTVILIVVAGVHVSALKLHLYWLFPWLDVFVHVGGAAWVSLFSVWLFRRFGIRISFAKVGIILACVSVGWELFEAWGGIPREANFVFDTSLDLLSDVVGGVAGYIVGEHLVSKNPHGTISSHEREENENNSSEPRSAA